MDHHEDTAANAPSLDAISADMAALAQRLPHRGSNTECEREAAAYLCARLRRSTGDAVLQPFRNPDNAGILFGAYYAEFAVVTLVAWWWPMVAFVYGVTVFGAYLAEFTGYNILARFLPAFESQNVVARLPGTAPRATIIVTAHYDTGRVGVLSALAARGVLHWAHLAVVCAMFGIVLTCFGEAADVLPPGMHAGVSALRAVLLGVCLVAAAAMLYTETGDNYVNGAVGNASGVAALLALADRLQAQPLDWADVHLVATSGKETWMRGMHHFLRGHACDRSTTFVLNLAHVGAGRLAYTTGEGFLHVFPASRRLRAAARETAATIPAAAVRLRAVPTDALIPLAHGYQAMSVVGVNEHRSLPFWRSPEDTIAHVDEAKVRLAADFAEGVLRRLRPAP